MEDTERTILTVLKEGGVKYKRIIEGEDTAFELEHRSLHNKNKIILFVTIGAEHNFRMFIYKNKVGMLDKIEYDCLENTWSVFNSLSLINKSYHD